MSNVSNLNILRYMQMLRFKKGAIQVLRNADGGGGVSDFLEKSITKV